jgi:KipI family sensor histidine kinase inhibitor
VRPDRDHIVIARLGDRAVRFPRPASVTARALVDAIRAWPGVVDVVVAREDIAAYFDGAPSVTDELVAALASVSAAGVSGRDVAAREHVLSVVYDGPDLDDVARATGLSVDEVIARHAAGTYVVDTMGFTPGFAYLEGLDPALERPRRATPRPRVPAGTVAIAGRQSCVYPSESPGGWHLLGRLVGARMFDAETGPLLALGDRVRFVRA